MKTGVQRNHNYLKGLDSARRNGRKTYFLNFYQIAKIGSRRFPHLPIFFPAEYPDFFRS
jgi:hypothetical protein